MKLLYKDPQKYDCKKIIKTLENPLLDPKETCNVLISLSLYDDDPYKYKDIIYSLFSSNNISISRSAITSIGHLVRRGVIKDKNEFIKYSKQSPFSTVLKGNIDDVIDDFDIYLK
ncbi:hypothetical protein [Avibacterium paragallinarum]|uniref:hypothetical protein n=1 Tax=Avibacterium paragallinarum TaxID=728 RepID=UPI00397E6A0F